MISHMVGSALRLATTNFNKSLLKRSVNAYVYRLKSYEGDGKTSISILNSDPDSGMMIDSFSQIGFRLNNGLTVIGPMAIFPNTVLSWNITGIDDVNENSLSLFCHLEPKIDILVLGIGDSVANNKLNIEVLRYIRINNVNVEVLPTEQACATFNFLNVERRNVAGAFIPPENIQATEDDVAQMKFRHNLIYKSDD